MTPLLPLVLGCLLVPAQDDKPVPLRYLRPAGEKYVVESEITVTPGERGSVYSSTTSRKTEDGDIKMTLTLHLDAANAITSAETVFTTPKGKKTATLTLHKDHARLKHEGTTEVLNRVPDAPVVTTAPDWSDVFQLVTRYDVKKGGKQVFGGIWFHPVEQPLIVSFTIERVGEDKIMLKEQDVKLYRHDIRLRSGGYRAWSDDEGRVVRIVPRGGGPIVLEGYEEATRELK
jgi:hypothetical protein